MGFVVVEYMGSNAIYFVDSVFPYRFFFDVKRIRVFQRMQESTNILYGAYIQIYYNFGYNRLIDYEEM